MQCAMDLMITPDDPNECIRICLRKSCLKFIKLSGPEQFVFPVFPIFFGHIRLWYIRDQLNFLPNEILVPNYICYDVSLCGLLFSKHVFNIGELTCAIVSEIIDLNNIKNIDFLYTQILELFYSCSSFRNMFLGNEMYCHD
ncbi:unnamed protein product [Rotaria sp. Silwood1]|nr:unnamed protein product [Rotaria sp. Silwood1]CAF1096213.1 unnamed protein product [Rotaria sp. Silwood1]CAF1101898.1 unnamed protein product [Rotaria sp. Silwood1]CAF3418502.1 unnamed protein product [Rotaria sp. Silwood1]CAF3443076.1 unnamed protein product [Rotaria sp. Silwood1]